VQTAVDPRGPAGRLRHATGTCRLFGFLSGWAGCSGQGDWPRRESQAGWTARIAAVMSRRAFRLGQWLDSTTLRLLPLATCFEDGTCAGRHTGSAPGGWSRVLPRLRGETPRARRGQSQERRCSDRRGWPKPLDFPAAEGLYWYCSLAAGQRAVALPASGPGACR